MTTLADLRSRMKENTVAFMPAVSFKCDVEETLGRKLSDTDWATIVENAEMDLDDVCEVALATLLKHVEKVAPPTPLEWVDVDEWETFYELLPNYLREDASWSNGDNRGCLFETYGIEWDFVRHVPNERVWSYVGTDAGGTMVVAGRLDGYEVIGYLVSDKPWSDSLETVVVS